MKPGDVVELKEGSFGLKGADTLGIYLERVKRKGNFFAVVFAKGTRREIKADHIRRVVMQARVDDPVAMSDADLAGRLRELQQELSRREEPKKGEKRDLAEVDDRRLWELVVNVQQELTAEDAARIVYSEPTREQLQLTRAALAGCQEPGVGYFERAGGRGERWRARSVDEVKAIRRDIEALRGLRNKLVHVLEELDEETGEPMTRLIGIPVDQANLTDEDRRVLQLLGEHMHAFILHDRETATVGLGGTNCHTMDGFIFLRFARFLAFDWLPPTSASMSGAFLRFLLETRLRNVREANVLVARRHVLLSDHFDWEYPERALSEAERLPGQIPREWWTGRRDLTALETYTIDPADAKDFDDAISIVREGGRRKAEGQGEGDTLLYVHIADVAQYVTSNSIIDNEARARGTSVYIPTGVLPMLPPRLADNLCSLKAREDRPALTAILRVAPDGRILATEFCESIIRVRENKAYPQVDAAIARGEEPFASLHALARKMHAHRRGLALETDELKVFIEHDSVDPHLKRGSDATRLIEQFMVAANEAVAGKLTDEHIPAPYRCHPLPDRSSTAVFNRRMEILELPIRIELPERKEDEAPAEGIEAADEESGPSLLEALKGGKLTLVSGGFMSAEPADDEPTTEGTETTETPTVSGAAILKGLAQLTPAEQDAWLTPFHAALKAINALDDQRMRDLVTLKMLACMGRALYTPENLGHFGLGSTCYLHFTSPIRRYPDLATHRQLKWLLRGREGEPPHSAQELATLTAANTDQSVEAEQLERDLISVALAFEARTEKWAGTHAALAAGITKGGVFVSLPKGVEARLATNDIPGGPWAVDEAGALLFKGEIEDPTIGMRAAVEGDWREMYNPDMDEMVRVRVRLGDRLRVVVADYDLVEGQIKVRLAGSGAQVGAADARGT